MDFWKSRKFWLLILGVIVDAALVYAKSHMNPTMFDTMNQLIVLVSSGFGITIAGHTVTDIFTQIKDGKITRGMLEKEAFDIIASDLKKVVEDGTQKSTAIVDQMMERFTQVKDSLQKSGVNIQNEYDFIKSKVDEYKKTDYTPQLEQVLLGLSKSVISRANEVVQAKLSAK